MILRIYHKIYEINGIQFGEINPPPPPSFNTLIEYKYHLKNLPQPDKRSITTRKTTVHCLIGGYPLRKHLANLARNFYPPILAFENFADIDWEEFLLSQSVYLTRTEEVIARQPSGFPSRPCDWHTSPLLLLWDTGYTFLSIAFWRTAFSVNKIRWDEFFCKCLNRQIIWFVSIRKILRQGRNRSIKSVCMCVGGAVGGIFLVGLIPGLAFPIYSYT